MIPGFADGLNGGVTVPLGAWVRCTAINETAASNSASAWKTPTGARRCRATGPDRDSDRDLPAGLKPVTVTGSTAASRPSTSARVYVRAHRVGPDGLHLDRINCFITTDPAGDDDVT